jgi:hypothetical protein
MNILDAYIEQYDFFNVIFSSVDYDLLKEIVLNLSKDFKAEFIDLFPIMINIEDIDNDRVKEMTSTENKTRFIIVPTFPYKYVKLKTSFHINISLNFKLISNRNIKKEYVDLENKYKETTMVNKYFNLAKYIDDTKKLENEIFNTIISRIIKKLDNGNYEEKLKNSESLDTTELNTESVSTDDFTTDKLVSKKFNHDVKEKYLEKKNESIDQEIMNKISDESIDPYEDINLIDSEDVNMDDKIVPKNDYSSMKPFETYNEEQNAIFNEKMVLGKRIIKDSFLLIGKRKLLKKMK